MIFVYVALIDVAIGRLIWALPEDSPGLTPSIYQYQQLGSDDAHTLPSWDAAVRHVTVAHQACSNYAFVGWDVAFTPHGPRLLEGNANWCADEYQALLGEPLGHTNFAFILRARLRALKIGDQK